MSTTRLGRTVSFTLMLFDIIIHAVELTVLWKRDQDSALTLFLFGLGVVVIVIQVWVERFEVNLYLDLYSYLNITFGLYCITIVRISLQLLMSLKTVVRSKQNNAVLYASATVSFLSLFQGTFLTKDVSLKNKPTLLDYAFLYPLRGLTHAALVWSSVHLLSNYNFFDMFMSGKFILNTAVVFAYIKQMLMKSTRREYIAICKRAICWYVTLNFGYIFLRDFNRPSVEFAFFVLMAVENAAGLLLLNYTYKYDLHTNIIAGNVLLNVASIIVAAAYACEKQHGYLARKSVALRDLLSRFTIPTVKYTEITLIGKLDSELAEDTDFSTPAANSPNKTALQNFPTQFEVTADVKPSTSKNNFLDETESVTTENNGLPVPTSKSKLRQSALSDARLGSELTIVTEHFRPTANFPDKTAQRNIPNQFEVIADVEPRTSTANYASKTDPIITEVTGSSTPIANSKRKSSLSDLESNFKIAQAPTRKKHQSWRAATQQATTSDNDSSLKKRDLDFDKEKGNASLEESRISKFLYRIIPRPSTRVNHNLYYNSSTSEFLQLTYKDSKAVEEKCRGIQDDGFKIASSLPHAIKLRGKEKLKSRYECVHPEESTVQPNDEIVVSRRCFKDVPYVKQRSVLQPQPGENVSSVRIRHHLSTPQGKYKNEYCLPWTQGTTVVAHDPNTSANPNSSCEIAAADSGEQHSQPNASSSCSNPPEEKGKHEVHVAYAKNVFVADNSIIDMSQIHPQSSNSRGKASCSGYHGRFGHSSSRQQSVRSSEASFTSADGKLKNVPDDGRIDRVPRSLTSSEASFTSANEKLKDVPDDGRIAKVPRSLTSSEACFTSADGKLKDVPNDGRIDRVPRSLTSSDDSFKSAASELEDVQKTN